MRSSRRSQRQRRRRVDNASAAAATRAHASTEDLPLTSSYPHRTALVVPSALASADRSFSVDDRDRVVRVGENLSLVSTAFPSVQFPAVPDDVDAFTYACAASAVANRTGRADGGKPDTPCAPFSSALKYHYSSHRYYGRSKSVAHYVKSDSPWLSTFR